MKKQTTHQNSAFYKTSTLIDNNDMTTTLLESTNKVFKPLSLVSNYIDESQLNNQVGNDVFDQVRHVRDKYGNDILHNSWINRNNIGNSIQEGETSLINKEKRVLKKQVKKIQNEIDSLEKKLVELKKRKEEVKKDIEKTDKECRTLIQKNIEITQFKYELIRIEEKCDRIRAEIRKPFMIQKFK